MTHPVPRSHHGLLFTAQFVEDVVGQLDASRPQLPCREQDRGREQGGEGGRKGTGRQSLFLDFYFEDTRSIRQRSSQKSSPESPFVFTRDYILH